jgi:hypothetical protein
MANHGDQEMLDAAGASSASNGTVAHGSSETTTEASTSPMSTGNDESHSVTPSSSLAAPSSAASSAPAYGNASSTAKDKGKEAAVKPLEIGRRVECLWRDEQYHTGEVVERRKSKVWVARRWSGAAVFVVNVFAGAVFHSSRSSLSFLVLLSMCSSSSPPVPAHLIFCRVRGFASLELS